MLDEVMAGLTPTEVAEMLEIVRTLHRTRELTILLIEHVMKALMRLSHRVLVLHLGRVVACARPVDIAGDARVQEIYLGESV
jgi:branched-chain amino acid transport system ATP-binding protein